MKEIEIKAVLRNKNAVVEKLKSLGCIFEDVVSQFENEHYIIIML